MSLRMPTWTVDVETPTLRRFGFRLNRRTMEFKVKEVYFLNERASRADLGDLSTRDIDILVMKAILRIFRFELRSRDETRFC